MYWSGTNNPWSGAALILFLALCAAGGWFMVRAGFRLPAKDRIVVGAGLGLCLATWLANLLSHWIRPPASFWVSAALPLLMGLGLWWRSADRRTIRPRQRQPWLLFALMLGLGYLFFRMGRGLAIFDDRKNLSMISILAAGDVPPHFYMNSGFFFAYHYGFQLLGAMLMRVGGLFPWSAFDVAKGIAGAMAVALSVVWGRRATGHWGGGAAVGAVVLFASGARWLLLLLPAQWISEVGRGLTLWGSAAQSGMDLRHALSSAWAIEGGPPFALPFAFVNGILQPFVLYLQAGPVSLGLIALLLLLILYPARARRWTSALFVLLLALWALAAEAEFVLFGLGLVVACAVLLARRANELERTELLHLVTIMAFATAVALLQGGTLTEAGRRWWAGAMTAGDGSTVGFSLRAAPAIVSSHLGELRLSRPGELLIGAFEMGVPLLLLPVAGWVVVRAVRRRRVLPVAFGSSTLFGFILPLFLHYEVDRDITRLTHYAFVGWILLAAAPVAAAWRHGRIGLRSAIAATGGALVFGGLVVSGSLFTSLSRGVYSAEILPVDAAMAQAVWNRLEPGSLVIDSSSWRAVAVTGRLTRSALDSSTLLPEWEGLIADPVVGRLVGAGFDYAYVDRSWWEDMGPQAQQSFLQPCVGLIAERTDDGANGDRRLYDLRACPPE